MTDLILTPTKLTDDNFAPYGEVIRFREDKLLSAVSKTSDNSDTSIKVITAAQASYPFNVEFFEKHPFSTQAFIPMNQGKFFVVVAPMSGGDSFDINTLKCFITDGSEGIMYHVGTWHSAFSCLDAHKTFAVIDRHPALGDDENINLIIARFKTKIIITAPAF